MTGTKSRRRGTVKRGKSGSAMMKAPHLLLFLSPTHACDKFPLIAEEGMLSSPSELGGPAKTEPLLTESMGGGGKITRGVCQASPLLTLPVSLSLSPCCCQPSGKTPSGPDTVMRERKSKWETDKHRSGETDK